MSTHAGQAPNAGLNNSKACRETVKFRESVAIGATGAPTQGATVTRSLGYDDPGFTISRTSTGLYAITFPKGRRAWMNLTVVSPAKTIMTWCLLTLDAPTGVGTFNTLAGTNAAAVTDPASGDVLLITLEVEL
jgi:hypothetical protein